MGCGKSRQLAGLCRFLGWDFHFEPCPYLKLQAPLLPVWMGAARETPLTAVPLLCLNTRERQHVP